MSTVNTTPNPRNHSTIESCTAHLALIEAIFEASGSIKTDLWEKSTAALIACWKKFSDSWMEWHRRSEQRPTILKGYINTTISLYKGSRIAPQRIIDTELKRRQQTPMRAMPEQPGTPKDANKRKELPPPQIVPPPPIPRRSICSCSNYRDLDSCTCAQDIPPPRPTFCSCSNFRDLGSCTCAQDIPQTLQRVPPPPLLRSTVCLCSNFRDLGSCTCVQDIPPPPD
jgi:hypothetical protein